MREGYGKSKLFFLVVISLVGILLMPYRFGTGKADAVQEKVAITVSNRERNAYLAQGCGVVYAKDDGGIWIVTAGHVLERAISPDDILITLKKESGKVEAVCEEYVISANADIAFLRIEGKYLVNMPEFPDKEQYDMLQRGDGIRLYDIRDEEDVIYEGTLLESWIYVDDFEQYMMLAECRMDPGMSGGGLWNENGKMIGIVCGANSDGILAAVPLHVVSAEYENNVLTKVRK